MSLNTGNVRDLMHSISGSYAIRGVLNYIIYLREQRLQKKVLYFKPHSPLLNFSDAFKALSPTLPRLFSFPP